MKTAYSHNDYEKITHADGLERYRLGVSDENEGDNNELTRARELIERAGAAWISADEDGVWVRDESHLPDDAHHGRVCPACEELVVAPKTSDLANAMSEHIAAGVVVCARGEPGAREIVVSNVGCADRCDDEDLAAYIARAASALTGANALAWEHACSHGRGPIPLHSDGVVANSDDYDDDYDQE